MRAQTLFKMLMGKTTLAVAAAGLLCFQATTASAALTFKLSNQFPPTHSISVGIKLFADKVQEYSKGEITVQVYDSGSLYRDADVLKAIRSGSAETGLVNAYRWSGILPAVDIFDQPFMFKDQDAVVRFLTAATPVFDAAFAKYGAKLLFWVDYGNVQFFNNKRPLKTPEDFKGLAMRSYAAGDSETLKALGASPTIISSSELYMALQRGTVDGTTTGMGAAVARKVVEVQKYMTHANYAISESVVHANLAWWNKLTQEQKDIISRAAKDAEQFIRNEVVQSEQAALEKVKKAGLEIYVPTAADRELFIKATEPVRAGYLKKSGDLGAKLLPLAEEASR